MRKQKGFTIIELIVVIAIIAVLAAVVAVSVMSYIAKSKNAAIQANMDSLPAASTIYFEDNESFADICDSSQSPNFKKVIDAITAIDPSPEYPILCKDSNFTMGETDTRCEEGKWVFVAQLLDKNFYCIDYAGNKINISWSVFNSYVNTCSCARFALGS